MSVLNIAPFLSLDSFVACVALSAWRPSDRGRYCLAAAFGLCDGSATLLSEIPNAGLLALAILTVCFMLVLMPRSPGSSGGGFSFNFKLSFGRRLLIVLPLALSIDNLLDSAPPPAALACAASSMAWALLGLQLRSMARINRWLAR